MITPTGAQKIIDARRKGMKPAEMIIISLIGRVAEQNHQVYVNSDSEYDFRWCVDLSICIYINQKSNWKAITKAVALQKPKWLGMYCQDRFKGTDIHLMPTADDLSKPVDAWKWKLDFLPWLDFQNEQFAWGD